MWLKKLKLTNFRIYEDIQLDFSPKTNIIIGNNAQGKTTILEAIYLLSFLKSPISKNEFDVIKKTKTNSSLKGYLNKNKEIKEFEVFLFNKEKNKKIDGVEIYKNKDYISKINLVLLKPDDINIITGSPALRRKFLNIEISQIDSNYLIILNNFSKILKIRNEYLKEKNHDINYLNIINKKFIESCLELEKYRKKYLNLLNEYLDKNYYQLTKQEGLFLQYETNYNKNKTEFLKELEEIYEKEKIMGQSLIGPHRDDFSFSLKEQPFLKFASQGLLRSCLISLKKSQAEVIKKETNNLPIMLLDDLFISVDEVIKEKIINLFLGENQVIMTTTDLKNVSKNILKNAKIIKIKEGKIDE